MNRLIITYNQNCNLKCRFCYIDFHYQPVKDKTIEIVQVAIENNFNIITFGGGDSFSKKKFRDACKLAKENKIFTHVDTNAKAIKETDIDFINNSIDLIGISLDSIGEKYNVFRESKNLYNKVDFVMKQLDMFSSTPIKINTIVTKLNSKDIVEIRDYILKFKNVKRWSLYQFFPLSVSKNESEKYGLSDEEYDEIVQDLNLSELSIDVECFKFKDRVKGYLFCDEEGNIYTNSIDGEYKKMFSIFEEDLKLKLNQINKQINPKTIVRYK